MSYTTGPRGWATRRCRQTGPSLLRRSVPAAERQTLCRRGDVVEKGFASYAPGVTSLHDPKRRSLAVATRGPALPIAESRLQRPDVVAREGRGPRPLHRTTTARRRRRPPSPIARPCRTAYSCPYPNGENARRGQTTPPCERPARRFLPAASTHRVRPRDSRYVTPNGTTSACRLTVPERSTACYTRSLQLKRKTFDRRGVLGCAHVTQRRGFICACRDRTISTSSTG
jgi:hypothetical protein